MEKVEWILSSQKVYERDNFPSKAVGKRVSSCRTSGRRTPIDNFLEYVLTHPRASERFENGFAHVDKWYPFLILCIFFASLLTTVNALSFNHE